MLGLKPEFWFLVHASLCKAKSDSQYKLKNTNKNQTLIINILFSTYFYKKIKTALGKYINVTTSDQFSVSDMYSY
ncbi:hypothetical protein BpHYR1_004192 [Brachionus plicatilis]|uniref:Uncharacterized protein n=1 Tax=Brachionus plicatilis TaxID=10195 RepID=A0A3M7SYQ3_BRAPC|nr:hypothetical protein BpHYR1_004192 [Brachionus plicatilis]